MVNRFKGFVSFDTLFCALPLLLMLSHMLTVVWMATDTAETSLNSNELTGKLAIIADYIIKRGAVVRENQGSLTATYSPNLIDETYLDSIPSEELKERMEFKNLEIGWREGEGTCIYRLVLRNDKVKKLYICGG